MKPITKELLLAVFLGLVVPWILLMTLSGTEKTEDSETTGISEALTESTEAISSPAALTMRLRSAGGTVTEMDMDTYLVGVLLAELPASFEQEAKKAQAVVARTYTWKAVTTGGKHADGSVCTDSTCCQVYIAPEKYLAQGGSEAAVESAQAAVSGTSGYVLTYEGELIEATYFSCSGGSTEDAAAVWGTDFPYLRATDSPGEEHASHYTDTVTFTAEEFQQKLGRDLSGKASDWFGIATYTAGGGVATMEIRGQSYTGTELRSLLGLPSTAFSVTVEDDAIIISTRGFGHRVGMSQYGADAMAVTGSTYTQILAHYYRGTTLTLVEEN